MKSINFIKLSDIAEKYDFNIRDIISYWFNEKIYLFTLFENKECCLNINSNLKKDNLLTDSESPLKNYLISSNNEIDFRKIFIENIDSIKEIKKDENDIFIENNKYDISCKVSGYWPLMIEKRALYSNDIYYIGGKYEDTSGLVSLDDPFKNLLIMGIRNTDYLINNTHKKYPRIFGIDLISFTPTQKINISDFYILESTFLNLQNENNWQLYDPDNPQGKRRSSKKDEAIYILYKKLREEFYKKPNNKDKDYNSSDFSKDLKLYSSEMGNKIKFPTSTLDGWIENYPEIREIKSKNMYKKNSVK